MKPSGNIFILPVERTEFSDELYAALGRALTFATRFEGNCRALAALLGIKREATSPDGGFSLTQPTDLENLVKELSKRNLFHQIQAIITGLRLPREPRQVLHEGREARNYIAHDFTLGIEQHIETEVGQNQIMTELSMQVERLAQADLLVCILMLLQTNEPLPSESYLSKYLLSIKTWVCELSC